MATTPSWMLTSSPLSMLYSLQTAGGERNVYPQMADDLSLAPPV